MRKIAPVYRMSALRVANSFRILFQEAMCVIAAMLTIEPVAGEQQTVYRLYRRTQNNE